MGLWGILSQPFKGEPKRPTPRGYTPDPYYKTGGAGQKFAAGADELGYRALQRYMDRDPGYSEEEKRAMYMPIAEQTKLEEKGALRRLNRGSVASGTYGSGGTAAGRGAIMMGGMQSRANARRAIQVAAADAALQDRARQIQMANQYSLPRLGFAHETQQGVNPYNMGLNQLDFSGWRTDLDQYNWRMEKAQEIAEKAMQASMMGMCWVAEAIFGKQAEETFFARCYVNLWAPPWFCKLYKAIGIPTSKVVSRFAPLRWALRPLFLSFARKGEKNLRLLGLLR